MGQRGLIGEKILLLARIFAVVAVWEALASQRPYRSAWSRKRTFAHIRDGSGKHFDPHVVAPFPSFPHAESTNRGRRMH